MGSLDHPQLEPGEIGAEEAALWQSLHRQDDQDARGRLFALHSGFAKSLARRHFRDRTRGDLELADIEQYAFEALLEAIERYDPERGVPFRGFASRRISGNIADGIRRSSEMREQISWSRRMRRDRLQSLSDTSGSPNEAGASALEALAELAVGLALGFMLEDTGFFVAGDSSSPGPVSTAPNAWQSAAWTEMKDLLARELAALDEREHTILARHYLDGMAFDHIASLLALSKGRVSQLHRAALGRLRKRMAHQGHFRLER